MPITRKCDLNYSEQIAPAKGLSHGGKITLPGSPGPALSLSKG